MGASLFGKKKPSDDEVKWDPTFEPLMKMLLGKKGIKTKSASEVGRKKVDYFRGRDFKKFMNDPKSEEPLKKKCAEALKFINADKEVVVPDDDKDLERLGQELIQNNFCYKAQYKPLNPNSDGTEKKAKKWPDRLARTPKQDFDLEGFYVVTYEGSTSMQHFLLACIIIGILLVCMFPVWPMWAKIGIWYLSVLFLFVYFGLLILRMVIYTAFWIVGFDFWIFPNINDEYCGFLDSFRPLYSWEKRKDDVFMLFVRFGSLAITAVAIQQIAETHSLSDVQDFITSSYIDVLDWGVDKLMMLPGSEKAALPDLEELKKEVEMDNSTGIGGTTTAADNIPVEDDDDAEEVKVDGGAESDASTE